MRHELDDGPGPAEPAQVELDGPVADPRERAHPPRGDDLGHEVAAEGAPRGAVGGGIDGAFVGGEEEACGGVGRAGGEEGAATNEGLVDEVGGRDDDERALAHAEREDGAVDAAEVADNVDERAVLEEDLEEVADDGPAARAGGEVGGGRGGRAVVPPEGGEEEGGQNGEEVQDIHL